ncbi:MAG: hypothetical protein EP324_00355 [Gammaproteobacteria bacterium]|nr:MAG: hypothetical protein EP324_00355 [Gammaproteobacteria bacterium]
MKYLLLAAAVLGIIYMVFIDSKRTPGDDGRPEKIYQREVEKVQGLDKLMQDAVDQHGEEMDSIK